MENVDWISTLASGSRTQYHGRSGMAYRLLQMTVARRKRTRVVFLDFTERQLRTARLRAEGWSAQEIADKEGVTRIAVYQVMRKVYLKTGIFRRRHVDNSEQLKRWLYETGLDVPEIPDTPETAEVLKVKKWRGRIKLGRIARAGFTA